MSDVTDDGRYVLAAWREGLVASLQVVRWADRTIEATAVEHLPSWVFDLSLRGPEACSKLPSSEFVEVPDLDFEMRLAIRSAMLDTTDRAQLASFVTWLSRACMGEDLSKPAVQFGYEVDHLWDDCRRMDLARELVRDQLPAIAATLPPIPRVLREMIRA